MEMFREEIIVKGKPVMVDAIQIENKILNITGNFIRIARPKEEWYENVGHPETIIKALKTSKVKTDIFTFWQRLPELEPKYNYYMEWEAISALPIKSFNYWWEKQISSETRNKVRKSQKKGIIVKKVDFDDELVKGIMNIFNETPIRRGKPFWHYGKDFDTVKKEWSKDLDRSDFIGAYYDNELIGFIKLIYSNILAEQVQNISMIKYRNKYPTNALIAKAVELCGVKRIPYLTYGAWKPESHAEFLRRHGFEKISLPRYYIPLTLKGEILIKLKLHRGIRGILPKIFIVVLLDLRARWYERKYARE